MPSETPSFEFRKYSSNDKLKTAEQNGVLRAAASELIGLMELQVLSPITSRERLRAVAKNSNTLNYTFDLIGEKFGNHTLEFGHIPGIEHFRIIDKEYVGANGKIYHPLPKYLPLPIADAHAEMDDAYKKYMAEHFKDVNDRPGLIVQSGYRSPYYQVGILVKTMGIEGLDHTRVAMTPPGKSQHHDLINTAIDINPIGNWEGSLFNPDGSEVGFEDTPEFKWMLHNAPGHGFWFPYYPNPKAPNAEVGKDGILVEPWHIQYVGKEHAQRLMEQHNIVELFTAFVDRDRAA